MTTNNLFFSVFKTQNQLVSGSYRENVSFMLKNKMLLNNTPHALIKRFAFCTATF